MRLANHTGCYDLCGALYHISCCFVVFAVLLMCVFGNVAIIRRKMSVSDFRSKSVCQEQMARCSIKVRSPNHHTIFVQGARAAAAAETLNRVLHCNNVIKSKSCTRPKANHRPLSHSRDSTRLLGMYFTYATRCIY